MINIFPLHFFRLNLLVATLLTLLPVANAKAEESAWTFQGPQAMDGWGKTATLTVNQQPDHLKLTGKGWDSKIYRSLALPAGYYRLTACGQGDVIAVRLFLPANGKNLASLNLCGKTWRTNWIEFSLPQAAKVSLLVHLESPNVVQAAIKSISITAATAPQEEMPKPEELATLRPSPSIIRGCTSPAANSFSDLRAWGANAARKWLTLKPDRYDTNGIAVYEPGWEKKLEDTEKYLAAARKAGMKVVLTIGSNAFANRTDAWSDPQFGNVVVQVWQGIARKLLPYRDTIWGYDLYNEPLDWTQMPNPPRQWRGIAIQAIKAIRSVDSNTWIVFESGPGGSAEGLKGQRPLPDSRVIYSVHCYAPLEFTHQGITDIANTDLAEAKIQTGIHYPGTVKGIYYDREQLRKSFAAIHEFEQQYRVPVLVGEFSVVRWAPKEDAVRYLQDMISVIEDYHWSWIYHGFREWHGWSPEHDETYAAHNTAPAPAQGQSN